MEHQGFEPQRTNIIEAKSPSEGTIIGDVSLGEADPRSLTKEVFDQSPDLLFHGAAKSFIYSPKGEFDIHDTGGDGSSDYGWGLYTTDNRSQAENYSLVRSNGAVEEPIVYAFMPHRAKMLDVRNATNPDVNGLLPMAFVEKWSSFLKEYISNDEHFTHIHPTILRHLREGTVKEFLTPVEKGLESGELFSIRKDGKHSGIFNYEGNGFLSGIFRQFMIAEGYDGMIYREGGEGEHRESLTGYVFYNYEAVDTWEGWQRRSVSET